MTFENQIALVTGASRGIGKALVQELLARGAKKVYALGKSEAILKAYAGDNRVVALRCDVADMASVEKAAAKANDVSLVFSNAGVLDFGNILDVSQDTLERNFATNFYGQLNIARSFAPIIERNGGGHITNVLTVVALVSMPALSAYNASKAAALSLTQSLRGDLAKKNIAVHAVFPGPVDTEMAAAITLPKTAPVDVAKAILDGIAADEEDIFPDPMAKQVFAGWRADPKALEKQFASM